MTLKLIDKDLKSKYAEVLYKNELSFEKEIDKRFKRISNDYLRNSQMVDASSQIFLNRIRQKRSKWTNDDMNFRDHYRLVCRNVTNKKLENLKQAVSSNLKSKRKSQQRIDPIIESKLKILENELKNARISTFLNNSEPNLNYFPSYDFTDHSKPVLVPKLPNLQNLSRNNINEDLYTRYSKSDRDFLDKIPAQVELNSTNLGKKFVDKELRWNSKLARQTQKNNRLQSNAIKDSRFKDLVNFLG